MIDRNLGIARMPGGFRIHNRHDDWTIGGADQFPVMPIKHAIYVLNGRVGYGEQDRAEIESEQRAAVDFLQHLGHFAIFTPSTPYLRGVGGDIRQDPLGLGGSGLGEAIDQMLAGDSSMFGPYELDEVFDLIDRADDLSVGPIDRENDSSQTHKIRIGDRFMTGLHQSVSAIEASEGALHVLFLLALTGHEMAPRMFAIDNFDQALHPKLARALTRMVCEQIVRGGNRQMLATTHNPLVLDGLNLLDDRIRLFTVERDSSGASQINRVTVTEELMAQAENGMSLSRLWTMGRLGGVPKYLF